ncbi:MAG: 16S rRNA (adenine(1518)-N(6)/adenine(1519)-N(6))-dimethyltransferase RsmA [Candidatus Egerieousia sp.]
MKRHAKSYRRGPVYEGVAAKKNLGQHFLADEDTAIEIVDSLLIPETDLEGNPIGENSVPVLEIGPGTGVLTKYLLMDKRIKLELCEVDDESIDKLRDRFPQFLYTLVKRDFLQCDLSEIFPKKRITDEEVYIIGNFPYNISSQIFFKILEDRDRVTQVVCMLQKEVAQRLASAPGGKDYGILSVFLQAWYDIEYLFTVNEDVFVPAPKVKSGVIRLWRNTRESLGCDEKLFREIVKSCYNQRRKTLRNSIKPILSSYSESPDFERINGKIEGTNLLSLRPEQLSVEDWITLTNCFA